MSSRIPRTSTELEQELRDQLELLKSDAANYDAGTEIAAKSIAGRLRVLLHDTPKSRSLLGQLGKKDGTLFHDTAHTRPEKVNPTTVFSYNGLINICLHNDGARYAPLLDDLSKNSDPLVPFDGWWNAIVVLDMEGASFARKDLVLVLANQDGGSHVDPNLDQKYYKLTRQNSLNWQTSDGAGGWKALSNPHYAAVRQIAHEVMSSLVPFYTVPLSRKEQAAPIISRLKVEFTPHPPITPTFEKKNVGRNDPCPCGSGKKFKKCHG